MPNEYGRARGELTFSSTHGCAFGWRVVEFIARSGIWIGDSPLQVPFEKAVRRLQLGHLSQIIGNASHRYEPWTQTESQLPFRLFVPDPAQLTDRRQNEAAGAADASRGVKGEASRWCEEYLWSQGGLCDQTSQTHAGRTPAT